MSWIRLGDEFIEDPALLELGDLEAEGFHTYVRCLSYSGRHNTDGHVPAAFARRLEPRFVDALAAPACLLAVINTDGSLELPRWREHLRPRVEVEELRAARAEAGKAGGRASGEARRQANREATGEANREAIASGVASTESNPVPSRPVPAVNPESPNPAPTARETDPAEELLDELEERGVAGNRANGHAQIIRDLVATDGAGPVRDAIATLGRLTDLRQAALGAQNVLRPVPDGDRRRATAMSHGRSYDDLVRSDADEATRPRRTITTATAPRRRNTVDADPHLREYRAALEATDPRRDAPAADLSFEPAAPGAAT